MNLYDLRFAVKNLSEHTATSITFGQQLDTLINHAHQELWNIRPWLFTLWQSELKLYPDIVGEDLTILATVRNFSRYVLFSSSVRDLMAGITDTWEGQVLEIAGREYEILAVISATSIVLKEPFRGEAGTTTTMDWTIKHRFYRLPKDCVQLLSFTHTDRPATGGSLQSAGQVPLLYGDFYPYQNDQTADYAQAIYRHSDMVIPPAEEISVSWGSVADTSYVPTGTYLELAWSFKRADQYGPLSKSVITLANTGPFNEGTVTCETFSGIAIETISIDNDDNSWPNNWEGYRKVLWMNKNIDTATGVRLGLPCWVPVTKADGTQLGQQQAEINWTESEFVVNDYNAFRPWNDRYIEYSCQQIIPYPRVDASDLDYDYGVVDAQTTAPRERFKRALIRYIKKPPDLLLDQDTSSMPAEFHHLIVDKTMEHLFSKMGDVTRAAYYAAKFEREVKGLERRYLNDAPHSLVRQGFDSGGKRGGLMRGPVVVE